jgi:exopolysaccharide biosynthesis protein YbjH
MRASPPLPHPTPRRARPLALLSIAAALACGVCPAVAGAFGGEPARATGDSSAVAPRRDSVTTTADSVAVAAARDSAPAPVDSAAGVPASDAGVASRDTSSTVPAVPPALSDPELVGALVEAGLENVSVERSGTGLRVAYENRRYRHAATALGIVSRIAGGPVVAQERRLGRIAAELPAGSLDPPRPVRYPSDGAFPVASAARERRTERSLDLVLRPRLIYELGRILDPVLARVELQPELRWNSWPGGRARAALVIPVSNNFEVTSLQPDIERIRPGVMSLEQFVWAPGVALLSGTAGLLADNRYGVSVGIARPLAGGVVLLDAQADLTGFVAFTAHGTEASTPGRWSGFAGLSVRPGALDLAVRARAARFLHGDRGAELELERTMGDLDIAFFGQRIAGLNVTGVRLAVPLPPADRPVRGRLRVMPVERFPIEYRDQAAPIGRYLAEVASREEYLRQLDPGALAANASRHAAARDGVAPARRDRARAPWVSWTGMTGFVNTPWCGVMPDRTVELGYSRIPRPVAYDHRGEHRNDVYYVTLGFLPRVEAGLRWTVIPGLKSFSAEVPESRLTDSDRMLSSRLAVLEPGPGRPGLALGIEDAIGTKRFHSTYIVGGIPIENRALQCRFSLGYAARIFMASRRTLDGVFGAIELSPWRPVAGAIEHDTEKWNASLGVDLVLGLRARLSLLDLRHPSAGLGWLRSL